MGWTFYSATGQQLQSSSTVAATQAEMEAGSSTAAYVTPARAQHHPGAVKAWVRATAAAVRTGSFNVSGLVDNAVGDWQVVFDTDFSAATYATVASPVTGAADAIIRIADDTADDKVYVHAIVGGSKTDTAFMILAAGELT